MAHLFSKEGARKLKAEALGKDIESIGQKMARQLIDQFNQLHSIGNLKPVIEVEKLLLKQAQHYIKILDKKPEYPDDLVKFNPSGASKCSKELYLKAIGVEEKHEMYPYHRRWTRNSTAVHGAVQKDLLLSEFVLPSSKFTVARVSEVLEKWDTNSGSLPAWEDNILTYKVFEHNGAKFVLHGKMDGILRYTPDNRLVGFEFKTKSNSIGQVGYYKLKDASDSHKKQCIGYFLLFGIRDYLIMYEGIAKDQWDKGAEAKPDLRAFHFHVTDEMAEELLDKFAYVAKCVEAGIEPPEEFDKCFFCNFKHVCHGGGQGNE